MKNPKIYLPDQVKWPENLGIPQRQINFDSLSPGEYILVCDEDGITAIRLNNHSENYYNITALYESGFIEDLHLAKPTIFYGSGNFYNPNKEVLLKFRSSSVKLYSIFKDSEKIKLIDEIFNYSNVWSRFIHESHGVVDRKHIAVKDWSKNIPIFITDQYNIKRILFLQEFHPTYKSRELVEVFKTGITKKIVSRVGYIDDGFILKPHIKLNLNKESNLNGLISSTLGIYNMKIYI